MTKKTRREFTAEFKTQMVQLYLQGKTKASILKEYDLALSSLDRWISQHQNSGSFKEKDNRNDAEKSLSCTNALIEF
ncbi:IS3 family transposase [Fusibacter sp. 3D3]|uniref:IS3 family transposase n=1 Tax=Fusibacter sp. 3D3 TaxID=1048380 RepID=UPI0008529A1E